jgi:hypothetical protein
MAMVHIRPFLSAKFPTHELYVCKENVNHYHRNQRTSDRSGVISLLKSRRKALHKAVDVSK